MRILTPRQRIGLKDDRVISGATHDWIFLILGLSQMPASPPVFLHTGIATLQQDFGVIQGIYSLGKIADMVRNLEDC